MMAPEVNGDIDIPSDVPKKTPIQFIPIDKNAKPSLNRKQRRAQESKIRKLKKKIRKKVCRSVS